MLRSQTKTQKRHPWKDDILSRYFIISFQDIFYDCDIVVKYPGRQGIWVSFGLSYRIGTRSFGHAFGWNGQGFFACHFLCSFLFFTLQPFWHSCVLRTFAGPGYELCSVTTRLKSEARFRYSNFWCCVGTCSDLATFRWHVPSPFRHG